jgi:2,3-bisphosphoglycerate-independent phosphoglycerate mutase
VECQPPHDIAEQPVAGHLPRGERAAEVLELMERSQALLRDHPINRARVAAGQLPATQIWLWGQGRALQLKTYQELYGLTGGVISAVDLVRGLGRLAGLQPILVAGATGLLDTNYAGKVQAALAVLAKDDFVFLHVEAPDECGHAGDARKKTRAIELFDERIVGPVWRELERRGQPYRLILCMDHRTPIATRGHTRDPVPMVKLDGPVGPVGREAPFDETVNGGVAQGRGHEWIRELLRQR